MFHKRLMQEFRDNMKYVAGMVATQWLMLIANVFLCIRLQDSSAVRQTARQRQQICRRFYCAGMCYRSACGKHLCQ